MRIIYMPMSTSSSVRVSLRYYTLLCGLLLLAAGSLPSAAAQGFNHHGAVVWDPLRVVRQKVTASDGTANSFFGSAAALQGNAALIGADGDNNFQGAAYIFFSRSGNGRWTEVQKLTASDGLAGDEFGYRVDLSRNTLVVGAFSATVNGVVSQGAAYVFTKSINTWSENQKLLASDGGLFDNFGASVALYRDTIVVGANGATVNGNPAQGAVYVFTLSNGIWTEAQKLTAQDGAAYDNFGLSVALQGSTILVGSPVANINGHSGQGAAYIFTNSGGTLTETQKLTANDGESNANFGNAVALDNHHALIGADVSTVGGHTSAGKAYIFTETGGTWSQIHTLIASDPATDDFFGAAVALDGPTVLVSTPHPVINGNSYQGAAYFFENVIDDAR